MAPARWPLLAIVLAGIAGTTWWLWPTDARRVRAACRDVAVAVSAPAGEPDVARLTRAARLAAHLSPDLRVDVEGVANPVEGREQVMALAMQAARSPGGLTVTLGDIEVVVDEGGHSATARTTATLRDREPGDGTAGVDVRGLALSWARTDRWRLVHATIRAPQGLPRAP